MITRAAALAAATIEMIELPQTIEGATIPDTNSGRYLIFLNRRLSEPRREFILEHELAHIRLNHYTDKRDLQILEKEADSMAAAEILKGHGTI